VPKIASLVAYRAVLESLGRDVVTASSGEEATRLIDGSNSLCCSSMCGWSGARA